MLKPTKSNHTALDGTESAGPPRDQNRLPDDYERHTTSFLLPVSENGVQHVVSFQYSESGFVLLLGG